MITYINDKACMKLYGCSTESFVRDVVWPNFQGISLRTDTPYTSGILTVASSEKSFPTVNDSLFTTIGKSALQYDGKLIYKEDIVYFGNLRHPTGTVQHMGDNLTGAGEGDDEQIIVDLEGIPAEYDKIVLVVNIYQAVQRQQHFGMIQNAFIRLVDGKTNKEICKYNLTEDYSNMTAMIFGEVYRHNGEWKFNAIGSGFQGGLAALCGHYGIEVA